MKPYHPDDSLDLLQPNIHLSEDIWEKVAMHMTTKEWVQVSGTCKAMSRVCKAVLPLPSCC